MPSTHNSASPEPEDHPATPGMADFPASFDDSDPDSQDDSTDDDDLPDDEDLPDDDDPDEGDNYDDEPDDEIAPDTPIEIPDTSVPEIDLPLHDLQEH